MLHINELVDESQIIGSIAPIFRFPQMLLSWSFSLFLILFANFGIINIVIIAPTLQSETLKHDGCARIVFLKMSHPVKRYTGCILSAEDDEAMKAKLLPILAEIRKYAGTVQH